MATKGKTVFFGPFFGELGWELAYWHGWVKKMCREKYRSYRKIAASYPGREPFYPDVDEFWPHPPEISKLRISQRGYITDFWMGNFPKSNDTKANFDKNIHQYAENLLKEYQKNLPADTIFFVPHKLNSYYLYNKQNLFGTLILKSLPFFKSYYSLTINFDHQILEELNSTPEGGEFLKKHIDSNKKIIVIFPRCRLARRPDKNWPREKYDLLIDNLQKKYPEHIIGIFGAPDGAYYTDGVPKSCFDFINLDEKIRLSVQLAALKQSEIAIGSISGALLVSLLAGCPVMEWGGIEAKERTRKHNFLETRWVYWPEMNPSVKTIENLIDLVIQKKEEVIIYPKNPSKKPFFTKSVEFMKVFPEKIISKIFLIYFRKKKFSEGLIK